LAAIEIMKLKHIVILQNKIDLVKEAQAKEQYEQILKFIQGIGFLISKYNFSEASPAKFLDSAENDFLLDS